MCNRLISVLAGSVLGFVLFSAALPVWGSPKVEQAIRAETAEQAVELATGEVLALIQAGKAYAEADPERFYTELEGLLRPLIDFPRFARNVMGPYYRVATPEQQERFAESFKWSLVRTYALALTEFSNGQVNVLEARQPPKNPDRVNVTQEIVFEGKAYMVVYRMRRDDAAWRVSNLIVEGINIGLNYKSQFAAAMKDPQYAGDMDAVIDAWVEVIEAEEDDTDGAGQSAEQTPAESAAPEAAQAVAAQA
jgi:phospholipid transport system substrate-binding protein